MTGNDIKLSRSLCKLTVQQFAELIGISSSTLYRWETTKSKNILTIGPFQYKLLILIDEQIRLGGIVHRKILIKKISSGLAIGGGLLGLYRLLDSKFRN